MPEAERGRLKSGLRLCGAGRHGRRVANAHSLVI